MQSISFDISAVRKRVYSNIISIVSLEIDSLLSLDSLGNCTEGTFQKKTYSSEFLTVTFINSQRDDFYFIYEYIVSSYCNLITDNHITTENELG